MADETFVGRNINRVWQNGIEGLGQREQLINGVDIGPGWVVTEFGETAGTRYIDLASLTEHGVGIVLYPTSNAYQGLARDLDSLLQDKEACVVQWKTGGIQLVYAIYQTGGATIKRGWPLIVGSEAGKLAPHAYAASDAGSPVYIVGYAGQDITTDVADDQKVLVYI